MPAWLVWLDEVERLIELATGTELVIIYTWSLGMTYTLGRAFQLFVDERGRFWPPRVVSLAMMAAGCLLAWPVLLGMMCWSGQSSAAED